ncbi:MAG: hypothetical protein KC505_01755 [Myxococcales bacterium]|nr:hypothetical protein [Myxococcales bacterium]USN51471.1 MAG: hypothetical protein H6731_03425 [Myxococcales bacterium]
MKNISLLFGVLLFFSCHVFSKDLSRVILPNDEATHDYNIEWWYYTGHLNALDENGLTRKFAFEMTVFRGSPLRPISGYVGHFALIDLDNKKHIPFERLNPLASRRPPAPADEGFKFVFRRGLEKWEISGLDGHDNIKAGNSDYAVDLQLDAIKPVALFGDQGIVDYGVAGKLAYYSRTRMLTSGTLTTLEENGKAKTYHVAGITWMDHQWGDADAANPTQMGWDWFSIRLDDGNDFMIFHIRDTKSKEIVKTTGFIIDNQSTITSIPDELIDITAIDSIKDHEVYYPTQWAIKVPEPFAIDFNIKARFADQKFKVPAQITPIYWEGSCSIEGSYQGNKIEGQGFTEMAGYE